MYFELPVAAEHVFAVETLSLTQQNEVCPL